MKRYNTFTEELKREFGCRVHRISLDAGFTCPNRDGTIGIAGCSYCGDDGSGAHGIARGLSIIEQLHDGKEVMIRKYKAKKFLAYFQAFSNTYAPVDRLRAVYDEALTDPDIVGLIVGTRPDCLPQEVVDLLITYSQKSYFWLEIGLQSGHDQTLKRLNRGHDVAAFVTAVKACKRGGLRVCAHIILGLPGEKRADMLATASMLNDLGVDGVKLHLMHVMAGTRLAEEYERGEFKLMDRDEYVGIVCDILERLRPEILIHRLTGDGHRERLLGPIWSLAKFEVLNAIDNEMERRGSRQGILAGN
jgi:radical SAM protein (TIGR01212 family)